jgi:homoserine kinase
MLDHGIWFEPVYLWTMKRSGIKVIAPASLSNLAVGFDILGLALDGPGDEVIVWDTDQPGISLVGVYGDQGQTSRKSEENACSMAAIEVLKVLGETRRGIALELHKKIPVGSGLGGSAASAVAGAMAVNELLGRPLDKRALLPLAMQAEYAVSGGWYPDNVCASMLGGLIFLRDNATLDVHRIPVPAGIYITVLLPMISITTAGSRGLLKQELSLNDAIAQSANLAGFLQGCWQSDFELLQRSLTDRWIEHQRAALIPGFYQVKEAAMQQDALGCSISGSGPAIFALFRNSYDAEKAGEAMQIALKPYKIDSKCYYSRVNFEGAVRC